MFAKLLTLLISLFALYSGWSLFFKVRKYKKWPKTTTKILEKDVQKNVDRAIVAAPTFRFEQFVKYSYLVAGKDYENMAIYPDNLRVYSSRKKIKKMIEQLSEQTEIFYNPDNPAESFIFLPDNSWVIPTIVIGIIMFVVSLGELLV